MPYFDLTDFEFKKRLVNSLIPFSRNFITMYSEKPDLYGPFWITTTLIVILTLVGNLARYFQMRINDADMDDF